MKWVSQWLFKLDAMKGMKYIFVLFVVAAIYSGYRVYDLYQEGDWALVNHSVNLGLFGLSALYYSLIIFWINENARRTTQISELIIENHELKHEILISKMPDTSAKK